MWPAINPESPIEHLQKHVGCKSQIHGDQNKMDMFDVATNANKKTVEQLLVTSIQYWTRFHFTKTFHHQFLNMGTSLGCGT